MKQNKKIIQFSAGKGPIECEWVTANIFRIFHKELKKCNIEHKILDSSPGQQPGTLQSLTIELNGDSEGIEPFLNNWKGIIQYTGKSIYRKFHKRKNWFIGIHEITDLEEISISDSDIEYQAVRSSGAGGQNVNKVNTAVRAIHKSTRTSVFAMDSRSQLENKKLAKNA